MAINQTGISQFLVGDYFVNPYPIYRKLHEESPVFWSEIAQAWIVTTFNEVEKGLGEMISSIKANVSQKPLRIFHQLNSKICRTQLLMSATGLSSRMHLHILGSGA